MIEKQTSLPKSTNATLLFSSGEIFFGKAIGYNNIGYNNNVMGEICFNTSMSGYQETLTDPSYLGQIINFTFPHIGNVGTNEEDIESTNIVASGLIVRNDITLPSNYRNNQHFNDWLKKHKITGISGIDTRQITKIIKNKGAQNVLINHSDYGATLNIEQLKNQLETQPHMLGLDLAKKVCCNHSYQWHDPVWQFNQPIKRQYNIVAIDYGAKLNILRSLVSYGCKVTVVPADTSFTDIMKYKPDGVFLSNGPGDPAATALYSSPIIQQLISANIAIFGICLGHQLIALALGAKTKKMSQGHRGANHPVKNLLTGKVEITSQNHGFVVTKESLPDNVKITHISLFDNTIEGIRLTDKPVFAVQYHPESSPGPHDSHYLFKEFLYNIDQQNIRNKRVTING